MNDPTGDGGDLAIRTRDLTRTFGQLTAVDHVSLDVPRGEIFGFLGPNGSGKTTTIRMMCGLLKPSSGEVEVLGLRVPRDAEALRLRIGYMTQRFSLYEDLTADENLAFMARIYSLPRRERRPRIDDVVERYRLGELRRQRAGTMSGGQRQRLALAAATLHRPDLLFLDEPTSAVDPENRRDFWASLFELVANGTTILVSTHYMDEAERCHQLAILDHGRLAGVGEPRQLQREIGLQVLEVLTDRPFDAAHALHEVDGVVSVAQLGRRLHLLMLPDIVDPERRIEEALRARGLAGEAAAVAPSLEDVFVARTRRAAQGEPA
jgi:ABC-2 type transport system ATP-binding protein